MILSLRLVRFTSRILFLSATVLVTMIIYQHRLDERLSEQQQEYLLTTKPVKIVATSLQNDVLGFRAKPGEVTAHGKPVLYWFNAAEGGSVPVALKTSNGFLVINENEASNKSPKSLYILASDHAKVLVFSNLKSFTRALLNLPYGTKLYRYDRCTNTASAGLPATIWLQIRRACRKADLHIMNQNHPILTCICSAQNYKD